MTIEFRIGQGYDLHRLEPLSVPETRSKPVRPLVVGGVLIEGSKSGVVAHSDGDVLYHAATDALLGALALPDIGQLFPDSAPENDGRDSSVFVAEALRRVHDAGWKVGNVDATVVLERPRIGPVKEKIRANLARLLDVGMDRVNVKGKSHEAVDAIGEGRAIEAQVVVLLLRG